MLAEERKSRILELLNNNTLLSVFELSGHFGVSASTIRRDLAALEKEGHVRRTRGGAVLEKRSLVDFSYLERERRFIQRKRYIAGRAVSLIRPGDRIFFNDGSTVMQIAKRLVEKSVPITVMTNSLKVADILLFNSEIEVILIGGRIREFSYACSGPFAELVIDLFNANMAFIGADGFHPIRGVSIQPVAEASLTRKMIANSEQVAVVGDSSKMGAVAFVRVCRWNEVDMFITDTIKEEDRKAIESKGVRIITRAE